MERPPVKLACLFPGQGSQAVGMAKDHFSSSDSLKRRFEQADDILGYSLASIMFEGPEDRLRQTQYTQPAVFLHSVSLFETLDVQPDMTAGHSLGEFSAMVTSGAMTFEDGLGLVSARGSLMQQAGDKKPGTMAAVMGMDDELVDIICEEAMAQTFKHVMPANYNCPGQIVISGDVKAVEAAMDLAKDRGCRLVKQLPVSGAFHSSLMESAYDELKEKLDQVQLTRPHCPVYSNYTAEPTFDPDEIRENVLQQLMNPVRWTQTLQNMNRDGAGRFVEIGPGRVLQGLVRRTLADVEISGHQ
ncbi:MAG: ACP S-malonyltransferase [Balneolaceae bacterium]